MRTVSIRQFNRCFYQEIKNLPLIVTKHDEKVFVVTPYRQESQVVTQKEEKKEIPKTMCKHGFQKGLCKHGCK